MEMGTKLKVIEDCICEHYLHEATKYPRPGLVKRELSKGDIVEFVENWGSFYGFYMRVKKEGEDYEYDIEPHKLEEI